MPLCYNHHFLEILFNGKPTDWNDIAGLDFVKKTVKEIVVFPLLRPDIFTGLRSPPKGILLFGPPGTGKTLIGILSYSRFPIVHSIVAFISYRPICRAFLLQDFAPFQEGVLPQNRTQHFSI